jgi:hypothetical protein
LLYNPPRDFHEITLWVGAFRHAAIMPWITARRHCLWKSYEPTTQTNDLFDG